MSEQTGKKSNPMGCLVIIVLVVLLAFLAKACGWGGKTKETTIATTTATTTTIVATTRPAETTKQRAVVIDAAQTTYQANLEGFFKCWQAQDWDTMSQITTSDWRNTSVGDNLLLLLSSNFDFKKINSWEIQEPVLLDKQNVKTTVKVSYTNTLTKEDKTVTISVMQKFDHNAWGFNPTSALGETDIK